MDCIRTGQPASCLNGFIDHVPTNIRRHDQQQRVIPAINFACNGSITGWSILASWRRDGSRDSYPYLLIWRSTSTGGDRYTLEARTELFVSDNGRDNRNYFFTRTANPPVQFQVGDVLGIFQPPEDRSLVRLFFERDTGPTNYYVGTGDNEVSPPPDSLTVTDSNVMTDTDLPAIVVQISMCFYIHIYIAKMCAMLKM